MISHALGRHGAMLGRSRALLWQQRRRGQRCRGIGSVGATQIQQASAESRQEWSRPVQLQPNEVHVWWAFTHSAPPAHLQQRYQQLLSAEDMEYVRATDLADEQARRMLSRVLLRTVLARCLPPGACSPAALRFTRNGHGKPFLDAQHLAAAAQPAGSPALLHFNVTHTPGAVGCAVSSSWPLGLDVELANRRPANAAALAARRLSPAEHAQLMGVADEAQRARAFMQLWTLKEAYVKARGTGINAAPGLKGFSIGLQQQRGSGGSAAVWQAGSDSTELAEMASLAGGPITFSSGVASGSHAPPPRLLLFAPSPQHVGALCIQPASAAEAATLEHGGGGTGGLPTLSLEVPHVKMWQCVPLEYEQPMQLVGAPPGGAACSAGGNGSLDVPVLGIL